MRSAWAKIDRAKQYLEQLKIEVARDRGDYGLECWDDFQAREHVFDYVAPTSDMAIEYGIISGEVISHTRTALEHAVWEVVPVPVAKVTGLPVIWEKANYKNRRVGCLRELTILRPHSSRVCNRLITGGFGPSVCPR
jgi:hypothetical protein